MEEDEYGSLLLKLDIFTMTFFVNPYPAKVIYLNFQSLEVVCRYRDPQLQVAENYSYLFNFITNICKSWCLETHFIPNIAVIWSNNKTDKNDNSRNQHDKG